jgi:TRAP-type mannitol/chloroaromatic compound transport system permease small subunit
MMHDGHEPDERVRSPIADRLESVIDWTGRGTAWICLVLVLLVAFNVILRYAFRLGPVALQELEWHLMSPIALVGMSYALRHGDHVRVDIFFDRFGRTLQEWIDLTASVVTVVIAVIIFKLSLGFVDQAYSIGEGSPDPGGLPHRFLLRAFIPLGFALLGVQAVAKAIRHGLYLFGKR